MSHTNHTLLQSPRLTLMPLTGDDAGALFTLYTNEEITRFTEEDVFLSGETPDVFAERIAGYCTHMWTLRLIDSPQAVIGDCALHHYDAALQKIEIGGTLLPPYWGRGLMKEAFETVMHWAHQSLTLRTIETKTHPLNQQAVKLMDKMGFIRILETSREAVFQKEI